MNTYSRNQFIGRTDRFSPYLTPGGAVATTVETKSPVSKVLDIVGSVLGDAYVSQENQRLISYDKYWSYYTGKTFLSAYDGNIKKVPVNFCSRIVRKRAAWAIGRKLSLLPTKGNEVVAEVLQRVWLYNDLRGLLRRTVKTMMITGDAFWYIRPKQTDFDGKPVDLEKQELCVSLINPRYCFPIWNESDPEELKAMVMQFPVTKRQDDGTRKSVVFSIYIDPTSVKYYEDGDLVKTVANSLGIIPFVHFANNRTVDNQYGVSELHALGEMNDDYNEMLHSLRRVVRYHGEPTTLIFGCRLADMERGANKIWSGLPEKARVENLKMDSSDIAGMGKVLEDYERQMLIEGKTPMVAYDSKGYSVANASGIAMSMLFQPLVEASLEDQDELKRGINRAHAIIGRYFSEYFKQPLEELSDDASRSLVFEFEFASLIPTDEAAQIDNALKLVSSGAWSKAELIRRMSGVQDTRRLSLEIAADRISEAVNVAQKQRALDGKEINFTAFFQGSEFIGEDFMDVVSRLSSLEEDESSDSGTEDDSE